MVRRALTLLAALGLLLAFAVPVAARNINSMNAYKVTNLVSDTGVGGTLEDPLLVNAWGITAGPMTPWWVANNATSTSTLYGGSGAKFSIEVGVAGHPTGTVFNGSADFVVTSGAAHGPARFLFATEGGQILGWNPAVPPPAPAADAIVAATTAGAIYKGLAIGSVTSGGTTANYLYATDFHHARLHRRRRHGVALGVHDVRVEVVDRERLERVEAHRELDPRDLGPRRAAAVEQRGRQMQPGRRRRD